MIKDTTIRRDINTMNIYLRYIKNLLKKREFTAIGIGIILVIVSHLKRFRDDIYVRIKYFLNKNRYLILKINGVLMKLDLKDKGLSRDLLIYKKREHFSTEFMKDFIKEDDFILEIGANKGYYALLEGKLAKKGKIYAIEPIKENFSLLEDSIKLNSFNNITLFPAIALSDAAGEKTMYIYDRQNGCSFTRPSTHNFIERRKISTLTLDEFVKRTNFHPSFIRMDVEGHEYEIIKGAINTIKNEKNLKFFIEMHSNLLSKKKIKFILNVLQKNNFKITAAFSEIGPEKYKFIKLYNYLHEKLNIPKCGRLKVSNYEELEHLLINDGMGLECFFEKNG